MMQLITWIVGNFPILMTATAMLCGLITIRKKHKRATADIFLGYLFFFAMGLTGLWGFVFHAFFPQATANLIGWPTSPFQFEIAMANLGTGVVGICGLRASTSYRIAGTLYTCCLFWGAAYGHIVQMIKTHDFAPGNAGLIFYNDLIMPLLLVIFLFQYCPRCKK